MFQVSGELCLLADVIQRQYLLIRICTGDRADGQDHVELSVTVSVCADVHVDVLIGQRPIAAFRQELIRITATGTEANTVELTGGNYKTGKLAVFAENENYDDFVSAGYYRDKDVVNYLNDSSIVVAEVRNGYAVGKDMVDSIVENMSESEKETITVINGDIDLTGVPAGITVKNEGDGKVTVNETKEVKKGDAPYTVPAKSTGGYYYYPSTSGITAELNGSNKSATDYPGGDYGLVFRSTAAFSTFQGVQVDGKTLAKSNYTAEEGSTVVYLKAAYLKTLAAGKHTVTILSTSGNTSMDFTVGGKTTAPQTFDAGVGIYAVTAVLSVTGMAWTAKKRH